MTRTAMVMKKLLLTGIAALFLTTGTAAKHSDRHGESCLHGGCSLWI